MKICLINALYYPNFTGGAEISVQSLAEELVKLGHEVIVITTSPTHDIKRMHYRGVLVYYIGLRNIYWPYPSHTRPSIDKVIWHIIDIYNPLMINIITNILNYEQPDILHTNNIAGISAAIWHHAKRRKLPTLHTLRDHYLLCPSTVMFSHGKPCHKQCIPCKIYSKPLLYLSNKLNSVVGISKYILNVHTDNGFFSNVSNKEIIHNSYSNGACKSKKMPFSGVLRVGYLGRLQPSKGIEVLLQALDKISPNLWSLKIGGRGSSTYEKALKHKYDKDNIFFLGYINPETILSDIDILIVPSLLHEGLGRTVFEAYTWGLPVIGSDRGGIPEIIDNGITGLIFNPYSLEKLQAAITFFIKNPKQLTTMGETALQYSKQFLPSVIASKYIKAYTKTLNS